MKTIRRLFSSPQPLPTYELRQRQATLNNILLTVSIISFALACVNFSVGDPVTGLLILVLFPTCLFALYENRQGKYVLAGIILCTLILVIADFDIYGAGGLISDAGVGAFPVVIIICSLLFGKRGLYIITALCMLSITTLGMLDINGLLPESSHYTDGSDVVVINILTLGVAFLIWVVMDISDKNLRRIKQDDKSLRIAFELTLEGLAKALEYRDKESEDHSQRVVEMTFRVAKEMKINDEELLNIKRGALLHDIGKLAIPDDILKKPGPLNDEEWRVMRTHPVIAREILETIPFLKPSINIPYCHHENWDGTGYPRGIKGKDIPLAARIFIIVDHWEALTADRVYRKAWPYEKVIAYIKENKGHFYDPQLVPLFLSLVKKEPEVFASSFLKDPIPVDLI
jgi:HD-GYP domain-containing protein (c-di-GMP phosphodiesterase class II)